MTRIDRDTVVCISLARQAGNFGTKIYNHVFENMKMNFLYKSFSTEDFKSSLLGAKALGIRGISVTMPYKTLAVDLVDKISEEVSKTQSLNTIVNESGCLKGYNTDVDSCRQVLQEAPNKEALYILGSGGFAKSATFAALGIFKSIFFITRKEWDSIREIQSGTVFNCTPVRGLESIFCDKDINFIDSCVETDTGRRLAILQSARQFNLYTGRDFPTDYVLKNIDSILGKENK